MHEPPAIDPLRRADGPQLRRALPSVIHPHADRAQEATYAWAVRFGLVEPGSRRFATLVAARFTKLAARAYAHVSAAQLELVSDFIALLFFYDDLSDGSEPAIARDGEIRRLEDRLLAALHRGDGDIDAGDPLTRAAADIHRRLRAFAAPAWLDRIADDMAAYIEGVQWERTLRAAGTPADLATYRHLRPLISAVPVCMSMSAVCFAPGDPDIGHTPWLRALLLMANNHISWVNDVYSVARELHCGNTSNLVMVLARAQHLALAGARDRAIEACNAELGAFMALAEPARRHATATERAHIDALARWMQGNLDWHDESRRYRGIEDLADLALLTGAAATAA